MEEAKHTPGTAPDLLEENKRLKEENREMVEVLEEAYKGMDYEEFDREYFLARIETVLNKGKGGE